MDKELSNEQDTIGDRDNSGGGLAITVYVLYLVGTLAGLGLVISLASVVGVILAYINKSDAPEWLQTHYQFQIRTFWIGIVYLVSGYLLLLSVFGYLVLIFSLIWLIVRCVKGLQLSHKAQPIPNPKTWLF